MQCDVKSSDFSMVKASYVPCMSLRLLTNPRIDPTPLRILSSNRRVQYLIYYIPLLLKDIVDFFSVCIMLNFTY